MSKLALQPFHTQNINDFIQQSKALVEQDLSAFLADIDLPQNLHDAVSYATLNGGKRVRPALAYAAYLSCSERIELSNDVRQAALAVELLHCYSLIHDDLPCMDDDDLRRGQPTCHIKFGQATALLAGDVLQTLAFEALAKADSPAFSSALLRLFSPRARRMVAGQMRDLNAENQSAENQNTENAGSMLTQAELEKIHSDKTGALIESAVLMGATCANASPNQLGALTTCSQKLGLAFQVQDDILDITASTEELGKPAGSDEKLDKFTYPKLMGLDTAKTYADTLFTEAKAALAGFSENNQLVLLADWLWHRKK